MISFLWIMGMGCFLFICLYLVFVCLGSLLLVWDFWLVGWFTALGFLLSTFGFPENISTCIHMCFPLHSMNSLDNNFLVLFLILIRKSTSFSLQLSFPPISQALVSCRILALLLKHFWSLMVALSWKRKLCGPLRTQGQLFSGMDLQ